MVPPTTSDPTTPVSGGAPLPRLAITMSGCGFLGSYHFGVVTCFRRHGPQMLQRVVRYGGASAGALVATLCALAPHKLNEGLNVLYNTADEVHSLPLGVMTPGYALGHHLKGIVWDFLPEDISSANGRLFVSLTRRRDKANVIVSEFTAKDHLMQHLLGSCHIPLYSSGAGNVPPVINGEEYIDGCYSDSLPKFTDIRTITVSPFSGEAEISPRDLSMFTGTAFDWTMRIFNQEMKVNVKNIVRGAHALFPPKRDVLQQYYEMGFRDAMKFLMDEDWFERMEGTPVDTVIYAESPRSAVFL